MGLAQQTCVTPMVRFKYYRLILSNQVFSDVVRRADERYITGHGPTFNIEAHKSQTVGMQIPLALHEYAPTSCRGRPQPRAALVIRVR